MELQVASFKEKHPGGQGGGGRGRTECLEGLGMGVRDKAKRKLQEVEG